MSSIDVFAEEKKESEVTEKSSTFFRSFYSFMSTRFCVLFFLVLDVAWFIFSLSKMMLYTLLHVVFIGSSSVLKNSLIKSCTSTRRSLVCGLCLLLSLCSPALGVMVGCAYFLMYDKTGIEEIVPNTLKKQFKELLSVHKENDQESDA
jgi:hypothetical protein